ncbi:unnamed protein product [Candidula unifasciata]|uniref:Uncharacterized protein n=1 Tax=Candidula unifasciata TaxID=100452 RepID=A0A8S3ZTN6_9EUPU|nr:unnamed protein product [Candidula unifasciata]
MPLLLSGADPVDSVMTQCWGRRAKLNGELTQARIKSSAKEPVIRTLSPLPPLSAAFSGTSLPQQFTEFEATRLQPDASAKVGQFRGRVVRVLLVVLLLLLQPTMGAEFWTEEQPDHVIFRYKLCQPVSRSNLMMMMGSHFDDTKMAPDLASARKMFGDSEGFQGDDPSVDYEEDSNGAGDDDKLWNFDENVWVDEREETVKNNGVTKDKLNSEFVESRTWLPRKKVLNRHVDSKVIDHNKQSRDSKGDGGSVIHGDGSKQPTEADSYPFMRRRRRRSHHEAETRSHNTGDTMNDRGQREDTGDSVNNKDDDNNNDDGDLDAKDTQTTNSIQLQLFLSGKDKKQRKKLKQKLRQSPVNLSKPPPWECKFSQRQRQMNKGVFPQFVLEGRCETDKCFYRLYNCAPIKYTLKLLQRDPNKCNPLPSATNITIYEERWQLVQKYVTVGCNCVSPIAKNPKQRNRRLD